MLRRKAKRAAAVGAARDPREISTTGKRRGFPAIIIRPIAQAFHLEPRFESLGEIAERAIRRLAEARR